MSADPKRDLARILSRSPADGNGCWVWHGCTTKNGYGIASVGSRKTGNYRQTLVHRFVYEQMVGPIPDGMVLDHLCRNRACCNPAHIEPVPFAENVRRGNSGKFQASKTHCPAGHEYAGSNLTYYANGGRRCKACLREHNRKAQQRKKEQRV